MQKTALVTASGKGIGAAIARRMAADGHRVVLMARSAEVEDLARELGGFALRGDIGRTEDIEALVALAREKTGRIDIVVANAGHPPRRSLMELTDADWYAAMDVLMLPAVRLSKAAGPDLIAAKGTLIAISSYVAQMPDPAFAVSSSVRAALANYIRLLAREWGPHGMSANIVAPGFVDSRPETPERLQRIPAGRYATMAEVADICAMLASPAARYITGQTLAFDGGVTA